MRRANAPSAALIGRDTESRAIIERIDAARKGNGGAVVVIGAPGIGKTSLFAMARAYAAENELQVLATTGVQSETHLPFAGLHQLLKPVLHNVDRLPAPYGKALRSAFGLSDEPVTNPFLIALAILQLLVESADAPLVLLVDDAQWLDASTAGALAFAARRLESDSIALLVALRHGYESPFLEAGITELTIEALTESHAGDLLDARSPNLDRSSRARVLESAAGNPLALVELLSSLRSLDAAHVFGRSDLPLTIRLERAFADRLTSLSSGTRSFLRVAAADERGRTAEVLAAATKLEGREVTLEAATEARAAGLVEVDGPELRFQHPLMRSAIHQAMSLEERRATHDALAATLEDDPDRRTWHRAAATVGTDPQVAAELEELAQRASRRGAAGVAIQAFERAAQLADKPERRAIHFARAANYAMVMGRASKVLHFLDTMDDDHVPVGERPFVVTMRESYGRSAWSGASKIAEFVEIAERLRAEGNIDRGMTALFVIANRCWWSNPDESTRRAVISALNRFSLSQDDPRVLSVLAMASPDEYGAVILDHLSRRTGESEAQRGGVADHQLGLAAQAVGDFERAERFQEARAQFLRAQGMLGGLTSSLLKLAWTKIQRGDWRTAGSMASESERLAEETGQLDLAAAAKLASATIAAYRGEIDVAERLATEGEGALYLSGANPQLAMVQWPRGVAALATGRYDDAYRQLRRIFEPSDHAHHPHVRSWVLVDLAEAAAHSKHEDDTHAIVQDLEAIAARTRSPLLVGALQFARAVFSPDGDETAFEAAADLASWPFTRARLQLAHGVWLRRHRRPADSRAPLRAARDTFDALGAVPWGERARQELRASGETSRRRTHDLVDALSPQELQIARLAAEGLTNKEIGQQLYLSHRTVGSHLYRIFPKLGITARSHLRGALQDISTEHLS
ncbi:MAG TPA: AAA family ATPase [Candidatus Eisenbacteria bacterium]|nr:AAA family ATPase [Candidatus Eisenbacteria bacterium]